MQVVNKVRHELLDTIHGPGLDPSDLLRADWPQPEVVWRQVLRVGRPGSVCLTGDDLVSKVGLKEISDQLSGVAPGTILL